MKKSCKFYLKTLFANIIDGPHLKRNTYLQIMSIGFFRYRVESICNSIYNPILVKINGNKKNCL